jgi:hypothetical protein
MNKAVKLKDAYLRLGNSDRHLYFIASSLAWLSGLLDSSQRLYYGDQVSYFAFVFPVAFALMTIFIQQLPAYFFRIFHKVPIGGIIVILLFLISGWGKFLPYDYFRLSIWALSIFLALGPWIKWNRLTNSQKDPYRDGP